MTAAAIDQREASRSSAREEGRRAAPLLTPALEEGEAKGHELERHREAAAAGAGKCRERRDQRANADDPEAVGRALDEDRADVSPQSPVASASLISDMLVRPPPLDVLAEQRQRQVVAVERDLGEAAACRRDSGSRRR